MPKLCLYFQLHQPYRLRDVSVFELGNQVNYFSTNQKEGNERIFKKVAHKSYLPMLKLLLQLAKENTDFKFTLSASGVFLEQALAFEPEIISLIRALSKTGQLEILSETYYHSLAFLYSPKEFRSQIVKHTNLVKDLFGVMPKVFRNTELIYSNDIANLIEPFNFRGMLTEAVDRYLHGRKFTQVFTGKNKQAIPLLLKHARLSDDLAFRFSDKNWQWHPLSVDRYLKWVEVYPENELVNLFMDFETFGEHQWADTGIFDFFKVFIKKFLQKKWNKLVTPSEVANQLSKQTKQALPTYDVPEPISWADVNRDLTAWLANPLQVDTLKILYDLEKPILAAKNDKLIETWRKLQTSDHFYYMCTKWSADGDVHAYFNPYKSPYEAYRRYSIVLADLKQRLL